MFEDILNGISYALDAAFPGCRIYGDRAVEQGLTEPCFFISGVSSLRQEFTSGRFGMSYPFDVIYFPADSGNLSEMNSAADKMFNVLRCITAAGHPLYGRDMSSEIIDSALHFFVSYGSVGYEADTEALMEDITVNSIAKENSHDKN